MPDMLRVVQMFLGPFKPHQRLWPSSGNTLRNKFRSVLQALRLPLSLFNGCKALELASIHAGSATGLMQTLESADLLQRRGRGANRKMMDMQERMALVQRAPQDTRKQLSWLWPTPFWMWSTRLNVSSRPINECLAYLIPYVKRRRSTNGNDWHGMRGLEWFWWGNNFANVLLETATWEMQLWWQSGKSWLFTDHPGCEQSFTMDWRKVAWRDINIHVCMHIVHIQYYISHIYMYMCK